VSELGKQASISKYTISVTHIGALHSLLATVQEEAPDGLADLIMRLLKLNALAISKVTEVPSHGTLLLMQRLNTLTYM
jgi:hypothetical protein